MIKHKNLIFSLLIGTVLSFLPILVIFFSHRALPKVPIEVIDDTLYYLTRSSEVMSGNIFIGNSYILEHVKDVTTSFFVGDWFYTLPFWFFQLFFNINTSLILSSVLWSLLTSYLLFILYKRVSIEEKLIPYAVFLSVFSTLFFIIRPVAMSVVYPVFLIFLIFLYSWLKNEEGKRERVSLVLSSVLSIYIYTYLGQLVVVVWGLIFLRSFVYKTTKRVLVDIFKILLLSLPFFYYTYKQINAEFYFDTLKRVGLLNTHLVGVSAIIYAIVLSSIFIVAYYFFKKEYLEEKEFNFFAILSLGLFIAGLSNVVTGKDLELAVHLGRFTDLFVTVFICFVFSKFRKKIQFINIIIIPILIILLYNAYLIKDTFRILKIISGVEYKDEYKIVIDELNSLPKNSVILSNDDISSYVPLTNQYVLFHPNAELYLASNEEIQDRYLVSRVFSKLDIFQIKSDYRKYAGVGNAVHEANIINKKTKICNLVRKVVNVECNTQLVDSYSLRGDAYFNALLGRYKDISKNPKKYLDEYGVDYIVQDNEKDSWTINIKNVSKEYEGDRFTIYKLN